ncbi:hypothetical protein Vwe01_40910 [Micromonospora andamanensis]|nr:hypothetical protein Vwe01_40910 [Micromonospora andamanensis]
MVVGSTLGVVAGAVDREGRGGAGVDEGVRRGVAGALVTVVGARLGVTRGRGAALLVGRGAAVVGGASAAGSDGAGGGCQDRRVGSTKGSTVSALTGPPAKLATTRPV